MRMFMYWNLHRKCWSGKALEGPQRGRVVCHLSAFAMTDCTFKVSEAGRQRVLKERKKNVHAGVIGTLVDCVGVREPVRAVAAEGAALPVTYNPYRAPTFEVADLLREPIHTAPRVVATGRSVLASVA